jgi:Glyoxalase-like domain
MSDAIRLSGVGVDCPNAGQLAAFYAEITGGTVTHATEQWASMSGPGGSIDFWTVPNHQRPTWPEGVTPKQLHLDFYVDDLAATGRGSSPPALPNTTSNPTPTTATSTPTRPSIRSVCRHGATLTREPTSKHSRVRIAGRLSEPS